MRFFRILRYALLALLLPLLLVINWRLYSAPTSRNGEDEVNEETLLQLRYLDRALHDGAGDRMQALFPEGFAFTHVLYGLSWAEVARRDSAAGRLRETGLQKARWALEQLESAHGRSPFDSSLSPPYGAFHAGWTLLLRGRILEAAGPGNRDSVEWSSYLEGCERLAGAFEQSPTPFLSSYPGGAWPADGLVGLTALRLHDRLDAPRYPGVISRWIAEAVDRLDSTTGLIPHAADATTGHPITAARGSSQSLMLRFLAEVDPALARGQYERFRKLFVVQRPGLPPGIREFPGGSRGNVDVDSGPVLFGMGASATVVAVGTARTFGDEELAAPLEQTVEATAIPVTLSGEKRYLLGKLPVMDAFLVWSKLAPHLLPPPDGGYLRIVQWWWRLPVHCLSALLLAALLVPEIRSLVRRRGGRT
jgi:hypothetical protein